MTIDYENLSEIKLWKDRSIVTYAQIRLDDDETVVRGTKQKRTNCMI